MTSPFDASSHVPTNSDFDRAVGFVSSDEVISQKAPASPDPTDTTNLLKTTLPELREVLNGVYVTVHGHFYQPPRENPYLDAIERQPSAAPFHDWNERIHYECYRPNAFARILNDRGEIVGINNNFEYLSFNIGATLMSWIERHDVEVYQRILDADRKSCDRFNGHGNAIAQVYNHIILPLANDRDKRTQIRWGKADFRSHFGRDPEGMWLAETAVDYATIAALIAEEIKFIVLAPSQAQRCRLIPDAENSSPNWHEVGGSQIDPTRPYRCFLKAGDPTAPYLDIFFYDGPISRDMGFDSALSSSHNLAGRLGQAVRGDHRPTQLISVATDGETFGHHKGGTEKCLAYAFREEFPRRGWTVTNFAHYLSLNPPLWEVELKPVTAWSCAHGVDRWQDDCGCGGGDVWHQRWRRPLRDALDWLRDQLVKVYDDEGRKIFSDPWLARDEYIQVVRDRSTLQKFLARHQSHKLTQAERLDALRLLEMQRHALLMYTSCGWFFEELSRPEGVQILRYAARALELAGDVAGVQLEKNFIKRLTLATSNVDCFKTGAEVYRQLVIPAQIRVEQVAAHYAISSLFTTYAREQRVYCYSASQVDYQMQKMGALTLAIGQLQLMSEITRETEQLVFAVLHLSGWDFHCCIQPFSGRRQYAQIKEQLFESLSQASAAQTILKMNQLFRDRAYSLRDLFAEERHRIMQLLSQETLTRLDQLYTQVYRDNYGVLMAFHRDELTVPQELQVAAEIALRHRLLLTLRSLEQDADDLNASANHLAHLDAIATEAIHMRCQLQQPEARHILERLIERSLWGVIHSSEPIQESVIRQLEKFVMIGQQLNLGASLTKAQEVYFQWLSDHVGQLEPDLHDQKLMLELGKRLAIDVSQWN